MEGRWLNHFKLEQFIGGGGMGAVFRAQDTLLGRTVAVKVLAAGAAGNDETRQRFHNEAQSAARLDHPNIARVHYVGEDQGFNYIVFEFLDGKNVRDLVADVGPLPLPDALRFTLQIAEALAHAWQRDIVHRDIKPSNVLATPEGQAKLVDMGLARLRDVTATTEDLTASGMTLGTFDYISPEQARDPRHADSRSDIYSLGCTLYFMLCGRPPFQGGTAVQKLLMHQTDAPPSPREFRPDLPAGVEQLLSRMLAKSPDDRFQNPAELIAAVTTLSDQLGVAIHPTTTTVQLTVMSERSSWLANCLPWLVPAALFLIGVFAIDYVDRSSSSEMRPLLWSHPSSSDAHRESADLEHRESSTDSSNEAPPHSTSSTARQAVEPDDATPTNSGATQGVPIGALTVPSAYGGESPGLSHASMVRQSFTSWMRAASRRLAEFIDLEKMPLFSAVSSESTSPVPASAPLPSTDRFIFNTTSRKSYTTLTDAWTEAADGDVLEIQREGEVLLSRSSLPLRVGGRKITLRGAAGHWPVLRIITSNMPRSGPRPSVFTIEEGTLVLERLELELAPEWPLDILGGWGLVGLRAGASVQMSDCRVTLRGRSDRPYENRDHDELFVALGDTSAFPSVGAPRAPDPVRIDLRDVVVRGGDTLVSVEGDSHVDMNVDNGLFVLRGYLYDGTQRDMTSLGASSIRMQHVTADLGEGAIKLRDLSIEARLLADVQHSIFLGRKGAALVEHSVFSGSGEAPLDWRGNANVYQGWSWIFRQQADGQGLRMALEAWRSYWAVHGTNADRDSSDHASLWPETLAEDPPFARQAEHYVVQNTDENPLPLDAEYRLPGMIIERLPQAKVQQEPIADGQ